MPIGQFEPIIGSSFDAIAGQRQSLLGLDASIQGQNLARQAQANREQQNWFAAVAEMRDRAQQTDLQRQLNADLYARQEADAQHAEALAQKNRAEDIVRDTQQRKDQLKYGENYLQTQQKIAEEKLAAQDKHTEQVIDAQGQHLAVNYLGLRGDHEAAQKALEDLHKQIDTTQGDLETERNKPERKRDANKIIDFSNRLKAYNSQLRQREADARAAEKRFDQVGQHAENAGFLINDDGTIVHEKTGKTWNWKKALKAAENTIPLGPPAPAAQAQAEADPGTPWGQIASTLGQAAMFGGAPIGSLQMADAQGSIWGGFTRGTGTTPPPAPMPRIQPANINPLPVGQAPVAPTPLRIGRYYTATPMDATQPQRARPVQVGRYTATPIEE